MSIDWITLDKNEGQGNSEIQVTANEHTGRKPRECILTIITTVNYNQPPIEKTVTVKQAGAEVFLTTASDEYITEGDWNNEENYPLIIRGISNGPGLYFMLEDSTDEDPLDILMPNRYMANGEEINNGESVGSIGEDEAYNFEIKLYIPKGFYFSERSRRIKIQTLQDEYGVIKSKWVTIRQTGDTVYLEVYPDELSFDAEGGAKEMTVNSSTHWVITYGN